MQSQPRLQSTVVSHEEMRRNRSQSQPRLQHSMSQELSQPQFLSVREQCSFTPPRVVHSVEPGMGTVGPRGVPQSMPMFDPVQRMLEFQSSQNLGLQQLLLQQQQQSLALTLPQPEVPIFKGDPAEYCTFIRAFEALIERKIAARVRDCIICPSTPAEMYSN